MRTTVAMAILSSILAGCAQSGPASNVNDTGAGPAAVAPLETPPAAVLPQERAEGESADQALARWARELGVAAPKPGVPDGAQRMALDDGDGRPEPGGFALQDGETYAPPVWEHAKLLQAFREIRDLRYLSDKWHPGFTRRLTWLYPDNGCFDRAEQMGYWLEKWSRDRGWGFGRPMKIFSYGNLKVRSSWISGGVVNWSWHVAPLVQTENGRFVIDPALDPSGPLTVKQWADKQKYDGGTVEELYRCSEHAYARDTPCDESHDYDAYSKQSLENEFVWREWSRVENLGYDAREVLGDTPPWH